MPRAATRWTRRKARLSHIEFSNESSLRTQGPQRERKALIAAARTLASALEQRPFFTSAARGYGSLRPQGRPAERLYEATTASTYGSIQSYAIALRRKGAVILPESRSQSS